jgi:hypothetical protein
MFDNILGASTETAAGAERSCERPDDHVHLRGVHVLRFRKASTGSTKHAKGPRLVENDAEFVFLFQLNLENTG